MNIIDNHSIKKQRDIAHESGDVSFVIRFVCAALRQGDAHADSADGHQYAEEYQYDQNNYFC